MQKGLTTSRFPLEESKAVTPWQQAIDQVKHALTPNEYAQIINIQSPECMIQAVQQDTSRYLKQKLPQLMSKLEPMIALVHSFSGAVDMFVQSNPSISALVWGSLKFVLELAARSKQIFENIVRALNTAYVDVPRYYQYAELFPKSERLRTSLVEHLCKLISLNCLLIARLRRNPLKNVLMGGWITKEREVNGLLTEIKDYTERIEHEAHCALMQYSQTAMNDLKALHSHRNCLQKAKLPCSMIPFAENRRFFGRASFLDNILKTFSQCRSSGIQGSFVLQGLGGVGKTEIALHFAHTQRNAIVKDIESRDYDAIFWIKAEEPEMILQGYTDAARRLGILENNNKMNPNECQKAVRDWLETTEHKWLIIFDNVSDDDLTVLEESWPSGQNGSILVTTRNKELPHRFSVTASREVDQFNLSEASEFFLSLFFSNPSDSELIDATDQVKRVVDKLDRLPIALSQIAGYMIASRCPLSTFMKLYENPLNVQELHGQGTVGSTSHYRQTIATVWRISISDLSEEALKLLGCLSFLHPDGISEKLIWGPNSIETLAAQNAIKSLCKHFLIKYNQGSRSISLHRLVQTASLQLFDFQRKLEGFQSAQSALTFLFRDLIHDRTSALRAVSGDFEMALPHVLSIVARYSQMRNILPFPEELGVLLEPFMRFLFVRGQMKTALSLFDIAEEACEARRGQDPYALMSLYRTCGAIYRNSNSSQEAHAMYQKALDICLHAPQTPERHRSLAVVYSSLGKASLALGRVEESLEYHRRGIRIREENEGIFASERDREDLALARINAAWAYLEKSDLERAAMAAESSIKVLREFAKVAERPTGEVSFGLRVLGNVRIAQSRPDEAFLIHQEALQIQVECFGYAHHETGDLCYKLACHHARHGEKLHAIGLLREALEIYHDAAAEVEVTGCKPEAEEIKKGAAFLRKRLTGLEIEEEDDLESYEKLVPYWGR